MTISIGLMMFPVLMIFIFIGFPVAFSLMGVGVLFGYLRFRTRVRTGQRLRPRGPRDVRDDGDHFLRRWRGVSVS